MKHSITPSGPQGRNTMKEFKEFVSDFQTEKSIESIITFFVDNDWFGEKLITEQGKILLTDGQVKRFEEKLSMYLAGTSTTMFKEFYERFPETSMLFQRFLKEMDEGKKPVDENTRHHLVEFMLFRLEKDLFLYKDIEMEMLLSHASFDLLKSHGEALTFFLAWMRLNHKTAYQTDYLMNKRYTMNVQNEAYSFDEYIQLLYYLFAEEYIQDNDMFRKAAESKNYTDTWLYLALHFIRPLRLTDMERIYHPELPYTAEEVIERIKNDTFTNNEAKGILLSITNLMKWLPLTPNKTEGTDNVVPIVFELPTSCETMIGKLFALAQAHRDIAGTPNEPIIRKISTYQDIRRYMGDEIGDLFLHSDFRSRSATKSFLQDICMIADENTSDELEGFHVKGYFLAALARSHKGSYGEFAHTTFEYLKDAKLSKLTPEMVAFELMQRGVCSFMASTLLKMAVGEDFEKLSPRNQTKIITTMDLSPKEIESIVTVVDNSMVNAKKIVRELITDEVDILTVLHRIGSGEAFSKQRSCSCLITALRKPCPYGERRLCASCGYDISTRSTMFEMITEYNRLNRLYRTTGNALEKAKYKNIIKNVVLPKMSEMLSAIRELYGEEVYRDYEELIKENT